MRSIAIFLFAAGQCFAALLFDPAQWRPTGTTSPTFLSSNYVVFNGAVVFTNHDGGGTTASNGWNHVVSNNLANAYAVVGLSLFGNTTNWIDSNSKCWFGTNSLTLLVATNYPSQSAWAIFAAPLGNILSNSYSVVFTNPLPWAGLSVVSSIYFNVNQTNSPTNLVASFDSSLHGTLATVVPTLTNDYPVCWNFAVTYDGTEIPAWFINGVTPQTIVQAFDGGTSPTDVSLMGSQTNISTIQEFGYYEVDASTPRPTWGLGFRVLYLTNSPGIELPTDGRPEIVKWVKSTNVVEAVFAFEGDSVFEPSVLFEGGKFKMWYSAGAINATNYPAATAAICYAESTDGRVWVGRTNVIGAGKGGEPGLSLRGSILHDGSVYYHYHATNLGFAGSASINVCSSSDGTNFSYVGQAISASEPFGNNCVVKRGSLYYMFVEKFPANVFVTGIATSSVPQGPFGLMLDPDPSLRNVRPSYSAGQVRVALDGLYQYWYHAQNSNNYLFGEIVRSYSPDLLNWTNYSLANVSNAIVTITSETTHGVAPDQVADPDVLEANGTCFMWYGVYANTPSNLWSSIALATYPASMANLVYDTNSTPVDVRSNLMAEWTFNNPSGTTADDFADNGRTATLQTGVAFNGGAADFDGSAGYITAGTFANFTSQDFSWSLWVYSTNNSENPVLVWTGNVNSRGYALQILADGAVTFYTSQGTPAYQQTSTDAGRCTTNAWHHLVVTRTGATVKLYVDGVDRTTTSGTHIDPDGAAGGVVLGNYDPAISPGTFNALLHGSMDDARVYSAVLSSAEVTRLYTRGRQ